MGDQIRVNEEFVAGPSRARSIGERILVLAFALCFLVPGGSKAVAMARIIGDAHAAQSWTETTCSILASRLREHADSDGDVTYSPAVTYSYQVGEAVYAGDRYALRVRSTKIGRAREVVKRLKPGGSAPCYYDPNDPSQALIERGLATGFWAGAAFVVFIVGAGALFAFLALRPGLDQARARASRGNVPRRVRVSRDPGLSPQSAPDNVTIDIGGRRSRRAQVALAVIAQTGPVAAYLGHMSVVPVWLWMSLHLVMLPLTYWLAVSAFNRTRLTLRGGYLRIERGPVPRRTTRTISRSDIRQIYGTGFGIRARLVSGASVSVYTTIDTELACYLERALEEQLAIEDARDPDESLRRKMGRMTQTFHHMLEQHDEAMAIVRATRREVEPPSGSHTAREITEGRSRPPADAGEDSDV